MTAIHDAFSLWDEEYDWPTLKGRKGRSPRGAQRAGTSSGRPARGGGLSSRAKLEGIVKGVPEVMVKITGSGTSMPHIKAHMDYISRHGALSVEDQDGMAYLGKPDMLDLRDSWAMGRLGIPEEEQGRKESYNIVMSMPAGTNYRGLEAAARAFAADEFASRQYAFAVHDDKDHTHVHLVVKSADARGRRLNPRKADLRRWREGFAERLREQGIEANATSRSARGVVHRPERQAIRGIRSRGEEPKRDSQQQEQARDEARGKGKNIGASAAQEAIVVNRKRMIRAYDACARQLVKGDANDKALAMEIVGFIKTLPPAKTKHALRVEQLRAGGVQMQRSDATERAHEARVDKDRS